MPADKHHVTVDVIIFTVRENDLQVLLVKRKYSPFQGEYAIPGGFVKSGESLEEAARRELLEETGVSDLYLEQLYTFGDPGRDPRGRVITVAYFALVRSDSLRPRAATDASEAGWFLVRTLPRLAFDHAAILEYALARLRAKLEYTTVGFQLLPLEFTLTELQRAYEVIYGRPLDKRNFRKKVAALALVKPLRRTRKEGPHRPARLYSFAPREHGLLKERGIVFPF